MYNNRNHVDLHLELGIKDLHIKPVLNHFLLADPLGFGFISFLIVQSQDLMLLCQPLDELWFDVCCGFLCTMGTMGTHATRGTSVVHAGVGVCEGGPLRLAVSRENHEGLVMLFRVMLLQLPCLLERYVCMNDGAQICSSIRLHNDEITGFHMKTGIFLDVENVRAAAFEGDNVQELILMSMRQCGWLTTIRIRHRILAERWWDTRGAISTQGLFTGVVGFYKIY